jgi:hypothetical protein
LLDDRPHGGYRYPGPSFQEAEYDLPHHPPHVSRHPRRRGGPLAETVLLGNLAIRVGRRIEWDVPGLRATNCPETAPYVKREYRKGWELTP